MRSIVLRGRDRDRVMRGRWYSLGVRVCRDGLKRFWEIGGARCLRLVVWKHRPSEPEAVRFETRTPGFFSFPRSECGRLTSTYLSFKEWLEDALGDDATEFWAAVYLEE